MRGLSRGTETGKGSCSDDCPFCQQGEHWITVPSVLKLMAQISETKYKQ